VTPTQFNELKPIRNPLVDWKRVGERVEVLAKPQRRGLLTKISLAPEMIKYKLDEIGATVWELCDGEHTCKDIVESLCKKYKFIKREAELSLMSYMQMLSARNLIGFVKPRPSDEGERGLSDL
jgi:hypothetical protein